MASISIPDLPPGVAFRPMCPSEGDIGLAFEAKRAAMGPHIAARWGWDEALQDGLHRSRYRDKPFFEIRRGGSSLGVVSLLAAADHMRFGEFYILPRFQRAGLGTSVLRHCLTLADAARLPVRLEHLSWNPVAGLYRRHGFVEIGRNDTHVFMERPAATVAGR